MTLLWLVCLSFLGQNPPTPVAPQTPAAPQTQPAAAATGPMRVELLAIHENRRWAAQPSITNPDKSELRIHMRLVGERIGDVVRMGRVVLDELSDDKGNSLLNDKVYKPEDRTATSPMRGPAERAKQNGLQSSLILEAAKREATTIKKAKGFVRVVYAAKREEIVIENPMQFQGKKIEDKDGRLAKMGLEINFLPPGNPSRVPPGGNFVCLELVKKPELLQGAAFHDAWMKPLRNRSSEMTSNDGKPCIVYQLQEGPLAADSQMILQVFPEIEEAVIPVEFPPDTKLP